MIKHLTLSLLEQGLNLLVLFLPPALMHGVTILRFQTHIACDYEVLGNSRPNVFYKKAVFKNFTKYTGKHLYRSLFFNKVADLD